MKKLITVLIAAGACSLTAFGAHAAVADHHPNASRASISINVSTDGYGRQGRYDRRDYHQQGYHRGGANRGRVVKRQVYNTRYRASIILTEELVRGRRGGPQRLCTVRAHGIDARFVSDRRMRNIARRDCSRRAQIRVVA